MVMVGKAETKKTHEDSSWRWKKKKTITGSASQWGCHSAGWHDSDWHCHWRLAVAKSGLQENRKEHKYL
jgi:hypothetical protein